MGFVKLTHYPEKATPKKPSHIRVNLHKGRKAISLMKSYIKFK